MSSGIDRAGSHRGLVPSAVRIGGMSRLELVRGLRERDVQLNRHAEVLFEDRRFETLGSRHDIEIAALSVAELGFDDGATHAQIVARASEYGLVECPLEVGPHLRLQFLDQPDSSDGTRLTPGRAPPGCITVASLPLDDTDETPKGFYLRRVDGGLWLRGYQSWSGHIWSSEDVLVFSRSPRP
jgi:hypothetical protein